ncbi:DDE_4 domain-containing protein [Cephalotus follicularis]|uniref:DDE_4 domain-containing protein n=1 Tax=Cephalotus follicularis TaxID=3775 RepID=A0A1Q3D770_CEPFO|nr:DDE_4 domain-containing protein [Cephalotus follicularis]
MDDKIRATILGAVISVLAVGHLIMEYYKLRGRISDYIPRQPYIDRAYLRDMYMNSLLCRGDIHCIDQIQMRPVAFYELCKILTRYNLVRQSKNMSIKEQVLLFVHCLGHNVRFRVLAGRFHRSSEPCHLYFRIDCVGAIDGTHVRASVPSEIQGRFRGKFYLGDAGYGVRPGIISPYLGVRYHLNEFSKERPPENEKELFNIRHSSLRTTIERGFGILKKRFRVLDAEPFWSFATQVDVVLACCVIHDHIMGVDPSVPMVQEVNNEIRSRSERQTHREEREENMEWLAKWDNMASAMWADYSIIRRV